MLTTEQAAKRLKVTRRRVLAMIEAGRLPAERFGNAWMIAEKSLLLVKDRKPGRPVGFKPKGKRSRKSQRK